MAYVFGRTSGDTQMYLCLWYIEESVELFTSKEEIIIYLSFIYKDPFKV